VWYIPQKWRLKASQPFAPATWKMTFIQAKMYLDLSFASMSRNKLIGQNCL
jgi:hypothetical protein